MPAISIDSPTFFRDKTLDFICHPWNIRVLALFESSRLRIALNQSLFTDRFLAGRMRGVARVHPAVSNCMANER